MKNKSLIMGILGMIILELIVPNIFAELRVMTNNINVEYDNNTVYIKGEGLNFEKKIEYSCSNNCSLDFDNWQKGVEYQYIENITCEQYDICDELHTKLANVSACVTKMQEDVSNYYPLYAQCVSNLSSCEQYKKDNIGYQAEKDKYQKEAESNAVLLKECDSDLNDVSEAKAECVKDRDNKQTWLLLSGGLNIAALIIIGRNIYKKKMLTARNNIKEDSARGLDDI